MSKEETMKRYYIVPRDKVTAEIISKDKEDAIVTFAANMDSDMNAYFKVLSEKENESLNHERILRAEKCLIDNGIEADEAETVLEALVYILMDRELLS